MTDHHKSVFDNVLHWLNAGYPDGVPPKDYSPVLALLKRSLTEEEVVNAARFVLKSASGDTVAEDEIRTAIETVDGHEPTPDEIHQVAARLASVGWPLALPAH
ncbi:DUF3349 domain-containing protein [Mycobacterium antarcticum]|uniref:DUF3349 domain-containing protein n=1 Tax=Mycolicibacterium sp. TUM20984 TaxID=3023368 RepID=UPI00238616D9|nr:DUF3349 domain-containing protein [Mycolicibacterium sp. TUM20984]GLP81972.1 hypothetical protein TUM20984_33920 [Mycolicibacterium sp. TUM20984]